MKSNVNVHSMRNLFSEGNIPGIAAGCACTVEVSGGAGGTLDVGAAWSVRRECASSSSRTCARITSRSVPRSACDEGPVSRPASVEVGASGRFPADEVSEAIVAARVAGLLERRGAGL